MSEPSIEKVTSTKQLEDVANLSQAKAKQLEDVANLSQAKSLHIKDPKKVTAGRAGARARSVKQERLLAELRDQKASMLEGSNVVQHAPQERQSTHQAPDTGASGWIQWVPWVVGAAGLAGVAWLLTRLHTLVPQVRVALPQSEKRSTPYNQLNIRDPFIME